MKNLENIDTSDIESEDAIIKHNLNMLNTKMQELLETESTGGGGSVEINGKKYHWAAANGLADPETGKIIAFTNYSHLRDEESAKFTLQIAFSLERGYFRIFNFAQFGRLLPSERIKISEKGKTNIQSAIDAWNKSRESHLDQ